MQVVLLLGFGLKGFLKLGQVLVHVVEGQVDLKEMSVMNVTFAQVFALFTVRILVCFYYLIPLGLIQLLKYMIMLQLLFPVLITQLH